jgi:hypothetical protein
MKLRCEGCELECDRDESEQHDCIGTLKLLVKRLRTERDGFKDSLKQTNQLKDELES